MTQSGVMAHTLSQDIDRRRVASLLFTSRAMDRIEESELVPAKKVAYQFSARGHDLAQILLGTLLSHPHDAASGYYRSRPVLLALGLDLEDALAGPLGRSGGYSDGRDIGVVCNLPDAPGAKVLPMAEVEKKHILTVYDQLNGNKSQTAKALGIGLNTLRRKLAAYGHL